MSAFLKVEAKIVENTTSQAMEKIIGGGLNRVVDKTLKELGLSIARNAKTKQIILSGPDDVVDEKRITRRTPSYGLLKSISSILKEQQDAVIVGTNIEYGGVHEYGFEGTVTVRSHQRSVAFGRKVAPFDVPSHKRNMKITARPYLQPALEQESKNFHKIFTKHWQIEVQGK